MDLQSDKCYILVAEDIKRIFLWKGIASSVRSKFIGAKRVQEIRGQVGMNFKIVPVDEGNEPQEFLDYFYKNDEFEEV